jgi:hypothetical protein
MIKAAATALEAGQLVRFLEQAADFLVKPTFVWVGLETFMPIDFARWPSPPS